MQEGFSCGAGFQNVFEAKFTCPSFKVKHLTVIIGEIFPLLELLEGQESL